MFLLSIEIYSKIILETNLFYIFIFIFSTKHIYVSFYMFFLSQDINQIQQQYDMFIKV